MAMQEIAKSNELQIDAKDMRNVDVKNLTKEGAAKLATDIVTDSNNAEQIKVFPDLWNSLNDQQKSEFISQLDWEIRNAVQELKDLWLEYSSEVTSEDEQKIEEFNFVKEHKDRIPQSWAKLEMKAKEVAQEMESDIKKEWLDRKLVQ